eukprot:10908569-Alexandrium_andersonii.AAC.1
MVNPPPIPCPASSPHSGRVASPRGARMHDARRLSPHHPPGGVGASIVQAGTTRGGFATIGWIRSGELYVEE